MNFNSKSVLGKFLNILFDRYQQNVPAVQQISSAMVSQGLINSQEEIINDHIAFRTLKVPHLGIESFEKIFLHHGYTKKNNYHFEGKKLNAYWYAPPSPDYPRIFISELMVTELSEHAQQIIQKYTAGIAQDPVDALNLNDAAQIGKFFNEPLWGLAEKQDYMDLLSESEYAAWVIFNRYYLNHYTISVHELKKGYNHLSDFNQFVELLGIRLNDEGGKIKISPDGLLKQSSTVAEMQEAVFANGEKMEIAGSYVEFAERLVLPEFAAIDQQHIRPEHRREGFEASNADKIFESTYLKQVKGNQ
jgi:hypothetical protein